MYMHIYTCMYKHTYTLSDVAAVGIQTHSKLVMIDLQFYTVDVHLGWI